MSRRFLFSAVLIAFSGTVSQVVYAEPQACEMLAAVSYLEPGLVVKQSVDKQLQHNLNAELLKSLGQKTQLTIKLESAQGRKALTEARSGRADLIIGVNPSPEKDPQLTYLAPAYMQKNYHLWVRSGEYVSLKQWPELVGLRGVQILQSKRLVDFDRQAELLNWPMYVVENLDAAVEQILQGQADYLLAEQQAMQQYLTQNDLTQRFEFIEPPAETQGLFLAMSKDSACNTVGLRNTLSKALTELTNSQ